MRRLFHNILTLLMVGTMLLATSCREKGNDEPTTTPQTLIVYLAGTLLGNFFSNNVQGIEQALKENIQGYSRVVVVWQNIKNDNKYMFNVNKTEAIELSYNKKRNTVERKTIATYDLPQTMDSETLGYIFKDVMQKAPAESYSLIIGAHGLGWIPIGANPQSRTILNKDKSVTTLSHSELWERKGGIMTRYIGEDSNPQNRFDVKDLALALSSTGITMEYILFDACFMANVESLYDLRNNAKYIISSPCEIMGEGFPYTDIMPLLLKNNGTSYDLEATCEAYYNNYKDAPLPSGVVSIIRCSQLEPLAQAMKLINNSNQRDYNPSAIQTFEGQLKHIFFDLGDYVEKMSDDTHAKNSFNEQLTRTILNIYKPDRFYSHYGNYGIYNLNVFSGLTTSAPSELYRDSYEQTSWYKATH